MNYAEMSDFEINGMIAESNHKLGDYTQARGLTFIHEYGDPVGEFGALCLGWKEFDPCNSWADAGTIIKENLIAIVPGYRFKGENEEMIEHKGNWGAENINEDGKSTCVKDVNPLRAAMIVFLMMREAK